ncbi:MYPU_1760 family metalloprotease [Mycoplasma nasistruthionis]|uniref:Uncharacterized protein n=1 Tax=Mycoplasma nasistruthionis TaxID=353852 RepID=A0A4Y6I7J7_9MOLU|nr:hypothetical protein [Mycoplasma nasistruthionis]QDF65217.1 hypothetical protein FIV53_02895 [Mycoplasma nasistruthionis]
MGKKIIGLILGSSVIVAGAIVGSYFGFNTIVNSLLPKQNNQGNSTKNSGNNSNPNNGFNTDVDYKQINVPTLEGSAEIFPIGENEAFFANSEVAKAGISKLNTLLDYNSLQPQIIYGKSAYVYKDPFTKIEFIDYSYANDENGNPIYLFGPQGLALMAQEFKRKVTFGPEVFDLKKIEINNFNIITENSNGLYIPNIKTIFINGAALNGLDVDLYTKVGVLMPTIFHEYMHHWNNSYAEIAFENSDYNQFINDNQTADKNQKQAVKIYYNDVSSKSSSHSHSNRQLWNGYFVDNFKTLTNYNVPFKSEIQTAWIRDVRRLNSTDLSSAAPISNYLYNVLSPKQVWNLANSDPSSPIAIQLNHTASKYRKLFYSPDGQFGLDASQIKYYYSATELVPREYSKYAFESYFSINDPNPAFTAREKLEPFSIGYFGIFKFKYNQNNTSVTYSFSPSPIADDYGKVFMNNFDSLTRQYFYQPQSVMMPSTPFALEGYKVNQADAYELYGKQENLAQIITDYENQVKSNKNVYFYKLFLETMGYGKVISQIYFNEGNWSWLQNSFRSINPDSSKYNEIKFSGYLDSNKYKGLVFVNKNTGAVVNKTEFEYLDSFNFFGHANFDEGAQLFNVSKTNDPVTGKPVTQMSNTEDRDKQIKNRIYPNRIINTTTKEPIFKDNYPYITKDFVPFDNEANLIYLWQDLNNNNLVEENEILKDREITLPENRWVTSRRSVQTATNYVVRKNSDNKTEIVKVSSK